MIWKAVANDPRLVDFTFSPKQKTISSNFPSMKNWGSTTTKLSPDSVRVVGVDARSVSATIFGVFGDASDVFGGAVFDAFAARSRKVLFILMSGCLQNIPLLV